MPEAVIAVLAGLLIGSFLNVCIYRMPRDLSVVRPRSFCPNCERTIMSYDNIPLLSYILLQRKCRYCAAPIPWRYPLVEALTAASFCTIVLTYGAGLLSVKLCVLSAILIGLIFSDFEQLILPDEFTIGGAVVGLAFAIVAPPPPGIFSLLTAGFLPVRWIPFEEACLSAAFAGGALWLVGKLYFLIRKREGLGFGDVKMIAMVAAYLGLSGALLTLILGSLAGSIIGLAYIRLTKKDASSYELPFGSFLGAAALLLVLAGGSLLNLFPNAGN